MSYGVSSALQGAVYQRLLGDAALIVLVGGDIFDASPAGLVPETYVSLGPEDVKDASDKSGAGAAHEFTVSVVSQAAGFRTAKDVAAAVSDALVDAPLILSRGVLISLNFLRAKADRVQDADTRRIDLRFRARVEDN